MVGVTVTTEWAIRWKKNGLVVRYIDHPSAPRTKITTRAEAEAAVLEALANSGYLQHEYEVVSREVTEWMAQ